MLISTNITIYALLKQNPPMFITKDNNITSLVTLPIESLTLHRDNIVSISFKLDTFSKVNWYTSWYNYVTLIKL